MARCDTCGNEYERNLEIRVGEHAYSFDSFECAIHKLAPHCEHCGCRILGHGAQWEDHLFCSAHCARQRGVHTLADHAGGHIIV